jgi:hypothetical protein
MQLVYKNDEVQQPVIFSNIKENQNLLHMRIFNTHTNNPYNKVFTWSQPEKLHLHV